MIDMDISDRGLRLISSFEGFSPIPYEDVAGIGTIGFGHRIRPDEQFTSITEDQGNTLLRQDVKFAESCVCQCVNVVINQNQYDSLVSFTYNLGGKALLGSTLLVKLNDNDVTGAANEFSKWVYAGGKIVEGLVTRRATERALFLSL